MAQAAKQDLNQKNYELSLMTKLSSLKPLPSFKHALSPQLHMIKERQGRTGNEVSAQTSRVPKTVTLSREPHS